MVHTLFYWRNSPMESFLFLVLAVCAVVVTFCIWALWCNQKTYNARRNMINVLFGNGTDNFIKYQMYFSQSDYDEHLWALILRRDWRKVYNQELVEAFPGLFN